MRGEIFAATSPPGFRTLRGAVKDAAEELIEEGLLRGKPTSYGIEVSLNTEKKTEIEQMIKKCLDDDH